MMINLEKVMTYSEGFLESTAQDYDMPLEQVEYIARHVDSSDFYDALEHELKQRGGNHE